MAMLLRCSALRAVSAAALRHHHRVSTAAALLPPGRLMRLRAFGAVTPPLDSANHGRCFSASATAEAHPAEEDKMFCYQVRDGARRSSPTPPTRAGLARVVREVAHTSTTGRRTLMLDYPLVKSTPSRLLFAFVDVAVMLSRPTVHMEGTRVDNNVGYVAYHSSGGSRMPETIYAVFGFRLRIDRRSTRRLPSEMRGVARSSPSLRVACMCHPPVD